MKRALFVHILVTGKAGQPVIISSNAHSPSPRFHPPRVIPPSPIRTGPGKPYTSPSATPNGMATR